MSPDENAKSTVTKTAMNGPQAAALERRLRQELEEQGILTNDDANVPQVYYYISFSMEFNVKLDYFHAAR